MTTQPWVIDDGLIHRGVAAARDALSDSATATEALRRYFQSDSGYAGATFLDLGVNDPTAVTPSDLLAVTTLSVQVTPRAIRRFAAPESATLVADLLGALPADLPIEDERVADFARAMAELHTTFKALLGHNPWVTASKLCARKRPLLFPVRDTVVVQQLGLAATYEKDWPVFAAIMRDESIRDALAQVARGADVPPGQPALRVLDVILWMRGDKRGRQ